MLTKTSFDQLQMTWKQGYDSYKRALHIDCNARFPFCK